MTTTADTDDAGAAGGTAYFAVLTLSSRVEGASVSADVVVRTPFSRSDVLRGLRKVSTAPRYCCGHASPTTSPDAEHPVSPDQVHTALAAPGVERAAGTRSANHELACTRRRSRSTTGARSAAGTAADGSGAGSRAEHLAVDDVPRRPDDSTARPGRGVTRPGHHPDHPTDPRTRPAASSGRLTTANIPAARGR